MPAKFTVIKNKAGSYRFTMSAPNGQVILTSQAYSTRSAALNGIASIRRNAVKASLNDTTRATVAKPVAPKPGPAKKPSRISKAGVVKKAVVKKGVVKKADAGLSNAKASTPAPVAAKRSTAKPAAKRAMSAKGSKPPAKRATKAATSRPAARANTAVPSQRRPVASRPAPRRSAISAVSRRTNG